MKESTRADWDIIVARINPSRPAADRVIGHLKMLAGTVAALPSTGCTIHADGTLAHKAGEDEEYVVWRACCMHRRYAGDSWNHPDVSAAILKTFVSEANHWDGEKHGHISRLFFSSNTSA